MNAPISPTTLAWKNLFEERARALVAITAVCFCSFLFYLQLGTLGAIRTHATLPYDLFEFDVVIASRDYQFLVEAPEIDRLRLVQAMAVPGVENVARLNIEVTRWTDPETELTSSMILFGIDDDEGFLDRDGLRPAFRQLDGDRPIAIDRFAGPEYGDLSVGRIGYIRGRHAYIASHFSLGIFFYTEGSALAKNELFYPLTGRSSQLTSLGLVKISAGANIQRVLTALRDSLPEDVRVATKAAFKREEQRYFSEVKPLGIMFRVGVLIAFGVGVVAIFQVLSNEISNRWSEYATLVAVGFGVGFVYRIGALQAGIFAVMAYVPATLLAEIVFRFVAARIHLPIRTTFELTTVVLLVTVCMCVMGSAMALQRIRRVDPADLY